jgi:hypothetical protein
MIILQKIHQKVNYHLTDLHINLINILGQYCCRKRPRIRFSRLTFLFVAGVLLGASSPALPLLRSTPQCSR